MHDKMQYDLLVHLVLFVLLLWSSSTTTAASRAETPMAKRNCPTHCGDISIPYPFGIGPNKDCYFDEWFEMVCNQSSSTSPHKLYLRRAQLEVLNVYANGTLRVKNPIAFFCDGYRGQQPANLSGSPFVYSGRHNKFTAVSCGYLALVSSEKYLVGGCRSICEGTSISPEDCEIGVNCCQTNIPPHLSAISTDIEDDDRRGREDTCNNYAFLVDQEWFRKNFTASDFSHNMDSVPVVLDWSLGVDNTSVAVFHRFMSNDSRAYDDPKPYCKILNATSTYTRQRLVCYCPPGFEGNPYLRNPCHDIDECTDQNRCGPGTPHCMNYYGTYTCYRHRVGGKTKIKLILIGLGAGVGLLLLLLGAWWAHEVLKKRKRIKRKEFFFKRNGGLLLEQQLTTGMWLKYWDVVWRLKFLFWFMNSYPTEPLLSISKGKLRSFHLHGRCGYELPQKLQELFPTYMVQLPFPFSTGTSNQQTYFWMKNTEQKLLISELHDQFPLTKLT